MTRSGNTLVGNQIRAGPCEFVAEPDGDGLIFVPVDEKYRGAQLARAREVVELFPIDPKSLRRDPHRQPPEGAGDPTLG